MEKVESILLMFVLMFAMVMITVNAIIEQNRYIDFEIGDVLLRNGSIIDVKDYDTINKQAVGIIFYVNKKYLARKKSGGWLDNYFSGRKKEYEIKALAVSLENLMPEVWADTLGKVNGINNSLRDFCGVNNNGAIISFGNKYNVRTPVFEKCFYYQPQDVPGWFVPSAGEATALAENFHAINAVNSKIGGEPFYPWYWTASETKENSALGIVASLQKNKLTNSIKTNRFAVRPIMVIKKMINENRNF